jgi:hypothetical protein
LFDRVRFSNKKENKEESKNQVDAKPETKTKSKEIPEKPRSPELIAAGSANDND